MIGQIRGTLIGRQAPEILVDVGGIGYEIQVPMTTLYQLPELGQPVTLLTHTLWCARMRNNCLALLNPPTAVYLES